MDELDNLYLFCFSHPDWYESPHRHPAGPEYLALVKQGLGRGWRIERVGAWYSAEPQDEEMAVQGWKIHVSAVPANAEETLTRALPVLAGERVPFKFAVDRTVLRLMNSAGWPRSAAGKFLTVYPPDTGSFRAVLAALVAALDGLSGPYVLSDRRPGEAPVHYRYGGFRFRSRLEPNGQHTPVIEAPDGTQQVDWRLPFWFAPEWAPDPLAPEPTKAAVPELADGRYRIESVIGVSTKGGVYTAFDRHTGQKVVIKEGRPHTGLDNAGRDAVALRRKEYEILLDIVDTGIGPAPLDFFQEWEHAYLVEEHVPGIPLGPLTTRSNPLYFLRPADEFAAYFRWLEHIGDQLAGMLEVLHSRGITYGDLSLLNVLVDDGDDPTAPAVRLVDFEAARRDGVDAPTGTITPGFSSPEARASGRCSPADDRYALGRVLLASMVLTPCVFDLEPTALDRFLQSLKRDIGFPPQLADRIRVLAPSPPATRGPSGAAAGTAEIERTITSTLDYTLAHLDTTREDRLFPADSNVFATNPLSVAYGAAGLAHALRILRGAVPPEVRSWMLARPISPETYAPSLYHGLAGIGWVLAEGGDVEVGERLVDEAAAHPLVDAEPNVLDGSAGVGLALLRLWGLTGRERHLDDAVTLAGRLLRRRAMRGDLSCWPAADGTVPIGYARGASGIAVFLLALAAAANDGSYQDAAESAARFDLAQARDVDGRFTAFSRLADGGPTDTLRHYWIDGSAGVGIAALRLWLATGESVYHNALNGILADCSRRYAVHAGLFEGLAGMANLLLDAHAATGDPALLRRARETARGILNFAVERPEGTTFPGNQGLRLSCDYATGSAGIALTLHRVAHPAEPNFNFLVASPSPGRVSRLAGASATALAATGTPA